MRKIPFVLFVLLLSPAYADRTAPGPYELLRIEISDLKDSVRNNRLVSTRITLPKGQGPFPLLVMSHGNGGNWSSHQHLVDHFASHGYVVMAPNHPASDTQRVFRNRRTYATGPDSGRDPAAVLGRPRDVSFLLDQAAVWNATPSHPLYGKLDLEHIGAVGHSYGSYTVQAVCGARPILDNLKPPVPPGRGFAPSMRDPRVDVGVVYSPSGPGSAWFDQTSFATLATPFFCFTGQHDQQLSGGLKPATDRYKAFQLMPAGDKYHLWLNNAGHNGWDDLSEASGWLRRKWKKRTPEAEDVVRISKALTLAFLDAYLRDDARAREQLNEAYATSLTGKVVDQVTWETR